MDDNMFELAFAILRKYNLNTTAILMGIVDTYLVVDDA